MKNYYNYLVKRNELNSWSFTCYSNKIKDLRLEAIKKLNSLPTCFNTNGEFYIIARDEKIFITKINK